MLDKAKQILMVLEFTEFRWTILDVLAQPEQELDAIMYLKSIGEKMRQHARIQQDDTVEKY